jgi:hypothetical protein
LHELLAVNSFAAVKRIQTVVDPGAKLGWSANGRTWFFDVNGSNSVALFKEPQSFPYHFAGGIVTATPNPGLDQFFQFGSPEAFTPP